MTVIRGLSQIHMIRQSRFHADGSHHDFGEKYKHSDLQMSQINNVMTEVSLSTSTYAHE